MGTKKHENQETWEQISMDEWRNGWMCERLQCPAIQVSASTKWLKWNLDY